MPCALERKLSCWQTWDAREERVVERARALLETWLGQLAGVAGRIPKPLWLWWRAPGQPDRAVLWRAYVHRFDPEHTCPFCKQILNWTTPRVRTPQQA